jgi:hypothetical protein
VEKAGRAVVAQLERCFLGGRLTLEVDNRWRRGCLGLEARLWF